MQVTVEEISPVEKKVAVQIEWPLVAAKLDEAYRELGRGVTLKGFRKGKVPRSMLEKMFARQVEGEVKQRLVQESFVKAAQQHEIAPVAEPVVEQMSLDKDKGFAYTAHVEVRAPFEPVDYFGVALEKQPPAVTAEELERALVNKRREFTEFKKIEGRETLAAGDVAFVDIEGKVGPHEVKRDGVMVDVGSAEPGEALPGLGEALSGVAVTAANHQLTFKVPGEKKAPGEGEGPAEANDIIGEEAHLKITVRDAREKNVPNLDDDFAKDTGEADTLDELKGKLKEKLIAEKEKDQEGALRGELLKKILEKNPFQVAPALVDRQAEIMIHRAKVQMAMRGVDPRTLNLDETRMKQDLRPQATDEVRSLFMLDAVATKEKVEITEADLEKRLAEMAKERNKNVPKLKAELQKEGKLDQIRHQLREEKTLDLLMSHAKITVRQGE